MPSQHDSPDRSDPLDAPDLLARHRGVLDAATAAIASRAYYSPYPETPSRSAYGEDAAAEGERAFEAQRGAPFPLEQRAQATAGAERSAYDGDLGITYPAPGATDLVNRATRALAGWREAGIDCRTGIALEILSRLNKRSFELAHAVMHSTGQAFLMAFQAGGTHAQERGLEAVAAAYSAMTAVPPSARWEKPQRQGDPLMQEKTFTVVPRGVALVVGCRTFPTWNSYPGLFASLVTGNPVIVKPHPSAILPLAITVQVAREVLAEAGCDPDVVQLAAEDPGGTSAATLALDPAVRIVDFTGSSDFGSWLETNARQAVVFAEKSGVNTVVVDSTDDYAGMLRNLAFSLSLYSGQMCTSPQNLLVPGTGVATGGGRKSPAEFGADLAAAVDKLLADPARALGTLGAIADDAVLARIDAAAARGTVVRASAALDDPDHPDAVVRTPLIVAVDTDADAAYAGECFGPVSFLVTVPTTADSIGLFGNMVRLHGALTAAVYSTDPAVLEAMRSAALDAGCHLAENFTGGIFVNQSAAFSDFHGTGANPAASATLTDAAFVTSRFHVLESRRGRA